MTAIYFATTRAAIDTAAADKKAAAASKRSATIAAKKAAPVAAPVAPVADTVAPLAAPVAPVAAPVAPVAAPVAPVAAPVAPVAAPVAPLADVNHSGAIVNVGGFVALENKAGKITATSEKRAQILNNLDARGVMSVALNGKGGIAKQARMSVAADTLESLLSCEVPLQGAQIATLRAFLIAEHGEGAFNRSEHKGLGGMVAYLENVRLNALFRFGSAETVKAQDNAMKRVTLIDSQIVDVQRLIVLRDIAIGQSMVNA